MNKNLHGDSWSVTATHATAAVASKTGVASTTFYVTHVSCSSDKAGALLTVKQGTTTLWQIQVGAGVHSLNFVENPLKGNSGALVSAEIDGTASCYANISGFSL